jgi:hypothetical protein
VRHPFSIAPTVGHVLALLLRHERDPGARLEISQADVDAAEAAEAARREAFPLAAHRVDTERGQIGQELLLTERLPLVAGASVVVFDKADPARGCAAIAGDVVHAPAQQRARLKLLDCFAFFAASEREQGRAPACAAPGCGASRSHKKSTALEAAPEVLFVSLQRFNTSVAPATKDYTPVAIPLALESLRPLLPARGGGGDAAYNLDGVVSHWGTLAGGHYVATVRAPHGGGWLLCDDAKVTRLQDAAFERELGEQAEGGFQVVLAVFSKRRGGGGGGGGKGAAAGADERRRVSRAGGRVTFIGVT